MFLSPLPCIDVNMHEYFGGFSHYSMVEKTNTKNGRTKMHAKMLCQMDQWPTKLKGCTKHAKPWHKKIWNMMVWTKGMVNQDEKHWWYLMM
jgi:hypothetical protein